MQKLLIRFSMISFWIATIAILLYSLPNNSSLDEKSLNIFTWGDILDPEVISEFEHSTQIKVNLYFYNSNEEMMVKLKNSKNSGYDLIIPSDYSVKQLIEEGLLKKIDKEKLHFLPRINPQLLNHPFDPDNLYSIPFEWEIFGLGIDKDFFSKQPVDPSWNLIFKNESLNYRIAMPNDPIQTFILSAIYLFGTTENLSLSNLEEMTQLFIRQKKNVEAYADARADYFLSTRNSAVAVASSSYICRAMRKSSFIQFLIPKEGTAITIENFCIPQNSSKENSIYQLINFLYSRESMRKHFEKYATFPAVTDATEGLALSRELHDLILMKKLNWDRLHFISIFADQSDIRNSWAEVKS